VAARLGLPHQEPPSEGSRDRERYIPSPRRRAASISINRFPPTIRATLVFAHRYTQFAELLRPPQLHLALVNERGLDAAEVFEAGQGAYNVIYFATGCGFCFVPANSASASRRFGPKNPLKFAQSPYFGANDRIPSTTPPGLAADIPDRESCTFFINVTK
jgi:hypothetical protein